MFVQKIKFYGARFDLKVYLHFHDLINVSYPCDLEYSLISLQALITTQVYYVGSGTSDEKKEEIC